MKINFFAKCNYDPIAELIRQTNTEERDLECIIRKILNTKDDIL